MDGEELFCELLGDEVPTLQAIWRDAGKPRDPAHPEIELELSLCATSDSTLRASNVVTSLRLASEDEP